MKIQSSLTTVFFSRFLPVSALSMVFFTLFSVDARAQVDCTVEVPLFGSMTLDSDPGNTENYSADHSGLYSVLGFPDPGEVRVLRRSSTSADDWTEIQSFSGRAGSFGTRVRFENNQLFVTSPIDTAPTGNNPNIGQVYIYHFSGPQNAPLQQQQVLRNTSVFQKANDRFSLGFDVSGDLMLVGSPYIPEENLAGAIFAYEYDGNQWQLTQNSNASFLTNGDLYGATIEMETETALIRATNGIYRLTKGVQWSANALYRFPDASFDIGPNWFMISTPTDLQIYRNSLNAGGGWTLYENLISQGGVSFADQQLEVGSGFAVLKTSPVSVLRAPLNLFSSWELDRTIAENDPGMQMTTIWGTTQVDDSTYNVYNLELLEAEIQPVASEIYFVDVPISPVQIVACPSAGISSITVSPTLPEGLSFNDVTRTIEGTPRSAVGPVVYTVSATIYSQVFATNFTLQVVNDAQVIDGSQADQQLGYTASMDAGSALVGAPSSTPANGLGEVHFYEENGGAWASVQSFSNPTVHTGGRFGTEVHLAGNLALVGGSESIGGAGAVAVFERANSGAAWAFQSAVQSNDEGGIDQFGAALALDAQHFFVGSPASEGGAVYIFQRNPGNAANWIQVRKIELAGGTPGERFGRSIALDGDILAVGAPGVVGGSGERGAVIIYSRDAGDPTLWIQEQTIHVAMRTDELDFGHHLDLQDGMLIVGTRADTGEVNQQNQVYLFERQAGPSVSFSLLQTVVQNGVALGSQFGERVAYRDGYAMVSSPAQNDVPQAAGRVDLYGRHVHGENAWTYVTLLQAAPALSDDDFGLGLALNGSNLVVGAPGYDVDGTNAAGRVYFYDRDPSPAYFAYADNPAVYTFNVAITNNLAVLTADGASLTNFVALPALPQGLQLSSMDGTISGTPSAPMAPAVYRIVAQAGNYYQTNTLVLSIGGSGFDFGDAPEVAPFGFAGGYPTFASSDGARHTAIGPQLGMFRDVEPDGLANSHALGDDAHISPDEDGITLAANYQAGITVPSIQYLDVNLQNPSGVANLLDAWFDLNHDGVWAPNEKVLDGYDLGSTAGSQVVPFYLPGSNAGGIVEGETFARFRLSTTGVSLPTGVATDGEVEDYTVTVVLGPEALDDVFVRQPGTMVFPLATLLLNDTPLNGQQFFLSGVGTAASGQADAYNFGSSVQYVPRNGFGYTGADSFTYTITENGGRSATATVRIELGQQVQQIQAVSNDVYQLTFTGDTLSEYEVQSVKQSTRQYGRFLGCPMWRAMVRSRCRIPIRPIGYTTARGWWSRATRTRGVCCLLRGPCLAISAGRNERWGNIGWEACK